MCSQEATSMVGKDILKTGTPSEYYGIEAICFDYCCFTIKNEKLQIFGHLQRTLFPNEYTDLKSMMNRQIIRKLSPKIPS